MEDLFNLESHKTVTTDESQIPSMGYSLKKVITFLFEQSCLVTTGAFDVNTT